MSDATTQEQAPEQNVELTVQDLNALRTIIDVAAQRGAFKPAEMTAVGTVYTKLSGFLDAIAKQAQASQPAEAEGQAGAQ